MNEYSRSRNYMHSRFTQRIGLGGLCATTLGVATMGIGTTYWQISANKSDIVNEIARQAPELSLSSRRYEDNVNLAWRITGAGGTTSLAGIYLTVVSLRRRARDEKEYREKHRPWPFG